ASTPVSAPAAAAPESAQVSAPAAAASRRFVVQVGAVSDQTRAQQYQQRLSQQFSVQGRVIQKGAVWRIQLGPFASKAEASAIQQRMQTEAQIQSFIARAQ
ncbi:SPOR domain-containing protein, partial [Salmonella enterica subsp. enterica serovar Kentucky]|uniref:SPOR domain-containing protein n=1 Tax=Salmonella enterica TaxID=28901 RepID=UPI003F4B01D0